VSRPRIKCAACKKMIPDHEPDVVLRQLEGGVLLDFFPAGPVLHIDGVETLICWERLVAVQLVED
jgi:hypothetical protein